MTRRPLLLASAALALVLAGCSSFGPPASPGALSAGLSARMDQPNATLDIRGRQWVKHLLSPVLENIEPP